MDRGGAEEVHATVCDVPDTEIEVDVWLPHTVVTIKLLRDALIAQHARPNFDKTRVRIATAGHSTFTSCSLVEWLGARRKFFSPGLAEMLGVSRRPDI